MQKADDAGGPLARRPVALEPCPSASMTLQEPDLNSDNATQTALGMALFISGPSGLFAVPTLANGMEDRKQERSTLNVQRSMGTNRGRKLELKAPLFHPRQSTETLSARELLGFQTW